MDSNLDFLRLRKKLTVFEAAKIMTPQGENTTEAEKLLTEAIEDGVLEPITVVRWETVDYWNGNSWGNINAMETTVSRDSLDTWLASIGMGHQCLTETSSKNEVMPLCCRPEPLETEASASEPTDQDEIPGKMPVAGVAQETTTGTIMAGILAVDGPLIPKCRDAVAIRWNNLAPQAGQSATSALDARANESNDGPAHATHEQKLAALFEPVGKEALEKMFPCQKWSGYVERASRNKLAKEARQGRGKFNPLLAGNWWLKCTSPDGWDTARLFRVLAKNLPARSKGSERELTGDID